MDQASEPLESQAIWLAGKGGAPAIGPTVRPQPGAGQIVVRAAAVAINPVDWILRDMGRMIFPWLRYPTIPGWDVAGTVVAVAPDVTRFRVGDRILGFAVGQDRRVNDPAEGAFQRFVRLRQDLASPIPETLTWEQAAVLPLALATAACGLFQSDKLALRAPLGSPPSTTDVVLVWGGSTSVGMNAIQLAVAAGYAVVATASPRNHHLLITLGASSVFDYREPQVVDEIIRALKGRRLAGALAIGAGSGRPCVDIVAASEGARIVALASPPVSFDGAPAGRRALWRFGKTARVAGGMLSLLLRALRYRVRCSFINGSSLLQDEIGAMIFKGFLPTALAEGAFRAMPEALVVGRRLEDIPAALDQQRAGVSARKIVVTLSESDR